MTNDTSKPVRLTESSWRIKLRSLVKAAILTRLLPEVWYLTESWIGPTKGKKILVIGSTLGFMSEALAKSGWSVTTVDTSIRALKAVRGRFSKADLDGVFELCPPWDLPYEIGSFDAAIAINSLEIYDNPVSVLNEMHRVLKPGSPAVVATLNRFSPWNIKVVSQLLHPEVDPEQVVCFSRNEFEEILNLAPFKVDKIKKKGQYFPLPLATLGLKLPIPGVYIALVSK